VPKNCLSIKEAIIDIFKRLLRNRMMNLEVKMMKIEVKNDIKKHEKSLKTMKIMKIVQSI
jgi:hypothetical protein